MYEPKSSLLFFDHIIWNSSLSEIGYISKDELNKILLEKKFENFELIKGDILKTIPNVIKDKDNTKIALLHLDMVLLQTKS